jgi:hypothetical protein
VAFRWVTNTKYPDSLILDWNRSGGLPELRVGEPMPTAFFSSERLKAEGLVGLYMADDEEVCCDQSVS